MRDLTTNERAVLAYAAFDPDAWWAHVYSKDGSDGKRKLNPEKCLREKVARWQSSYDEAPAELKTRIQIDAAEKLAQE